MNSYSSSLLSTLLRKIDCNYDLKRQCELIVKAMFCLSLCRLQEMEELYEAKCREGEVRKLFLSGLSWRSGVVFIAIVSYHGSCSVFPFSITFPCSCFKVSLQIEEVGSPSKESLTKHHYPSPYVSKWLCACVYNHRRKPTLILPGFKILTPGISQGRSPLKSSSFLD